MRLGFTGTYLLGLRVLVGVLRQFRLSLRVRPTCWGLKVGLPVGFGFKG